MDGIKKPVGTCLSDEQIEEMTPQQIRELVQENNRLKQELRIRDNDILSHDQVFDAIVSGTLHVILVMSVTDYTAEFVTSNVETALGISRVEAMEDVRRLGHSFENIEDYNGREEIYIHRTNGARRQYLVYTIHLPYGRSDRVAVVLLCRSSAARGDLDEMMLRQAQDINRAAGYFLSSMRHDFHVPLSAITGYVLLLLKNADSPEKVKDYAHQIGLACQGILSTVDQILDMSRIETTQIALEEEEFGLGLALEETSSLISSLARARDLQFLYSASGIEHDILFGDRERIMEMLRLVLSNAVKYTPPGGTVELKVAASVDEAEKTTSLCFEIRDTGVGMEAETLQKYFYGEIPDDPESVPGRGTGIWLARRVIDMMGGNISAESLPGEGTTIRIRLKLKTVNSGGAEFWARRGIRRVLISDRNIQESARIRNLLKSAGVAAMSVSSGYGALKMIEQAAAGGMEYDLILLDEELRDMDWREVVNGVSRMSWFKSPYIFLMTGSRLSPAREQDGTGMDAVHMLQKPFYVSSFRKAAEQVCEKLNSDGLVYEEEEEASVAGLRFLVAEDLAINAERLRELLEISGARCEIAGNGRAALAMFTNSKPGSYDVILMDIQMPVMDGYAAASAIRGLERDDARTVPIIAMTTNSFEEDANRIRKAGIDAHIKKPLNIRALQNYLRRLFRQSARTS